MSRAFANWDNYSNGRRVGELTHSGRADRILTRAEGGMAPPSSRSMASEPVKIDNMDKLALALAAFMTLAPLFAAAVGALVVSS